MLAVINGDYAAQGNNLRTVSGSEALLQQIQMKLTAHRGQFPFLEKFGSRLWTLTRLHPAERQAAAEQYVAEALSDDTELRVESVTLEENDGTTRLTAAVAVQGGHLTAEVILQ